MWIQSFRSNNLHQTHVQLRPKPIVLHVNRQVQSETAFSSTVLGPESYPCDGMMPVAWNDAHVMEERYPCDEMNLADKTMLLISRKLAFRLELELSFRNSTGGLGWLGHKLPLVGLFLDSGPVFGLPFSSAGLFWTLFIFRRPVFGLSLFARACFWTPLVFHRHVFGTIFLVRACFWNPCVFRGPVFGLLCLPRACFYMSFVFRGRVFGLPLMSSTMGLFLDTFFGLLGGPFWCRWCVLGFPFE